MYRLNKLSLWMKMNLNIILIMVGLFIAVSLLLINAVNNLIEGVGQYRIEQEVTLIQSRFAESEQVILSGVKALVSSPPLISALVDEDITRIRTATLIAARTYSFDDIEIIDTDGERIFRYEGNVTTETNANEIKNDLLALSLLGVENTDIIPGEIGGQPVLLLAAVAPIRDTSGRIIGGVMGSSALDSNYLDALNFSREDIDLTLISSGKIVVAANVEEQAGLTLDESVDPYQVSIEQALSGSPVFADDIVDIGGGPHALAHIPLNIGRRNNEVLRIWVDVSNLIAFQNQLIATFAIVFSVLGFVALVTMGLFVRTMLIVPLRNLQLVAEQLTSGAIDQRARVGSSDEIGQLAESFNTMAEKLQQMIEVERESAVITAEIVSHYMNFVGQVTDGDLTARLDTDALHFDEVRGDLYILGVNLNMMVESLASMAQQSREVANSVLVAVAEVQAATAQQLVSATEQERAITQTMDTVEEVRTIVQQVTDRAQAVAQTAQQSVDVSMAGQEAVGDSLDGMYNISQQVADITSNILTLSEHTQQIESIIITVTGLADQSNLLALNASIESARAGEVGRGFAVVASEVRELAAQSRGATARVAEILSEIQQTTQNAVMVTEEGSKGTEHGITLVVHAGEAIQELAVVINQAAQAAVQISKDTHQQNVGMEQLVTAMMAIKQASSQVAISANQVDQSARNLNNTALQMGETLAHYQVSGDGLSGDET